MAEIKLAAFTRCVNAQCLAAVPYNRVLLAVIEGHLPGSMRGGRWFVDQNDVATAVEYFSRPPATRKRFR